MRGGSLQTALTDLHDNGLVKRFTGVHHVSLFLVCAAELFIRRRRRRFPPQT